MEEIMVTIVCKVYNHARFLRQTLEGFVRQKTDFRFEAIVHDDASTDGSADIIREFEARYPEIIKAVYQTENQYSKGVGIFDNFMKPLVRGKYYAMCEGDDCWIDDKKLAKQVEYMESHPDCTFCFTNAIMENVQNGKRKLMLPFTEDEEKYFTKDGRYNLVQLAHLAFIPAASFLYPVSNVDRLPDYYNEPCWGGDRRISLFAAALGYAYYIDEPTCCYHYGVKGSAMTKNKSKKQVANIERTFVTLNNNLSRYTDGKYSDFFRADNLKYLRNILMLTGDESFLSEEELQQVYENDSVKTRIIRFVVSHMSDNLFNRLRGLKRKVN